LIKSLGFREEDGLGRETDLIQKTGKDPEVSIVPFLLVFRGTQST
jgi:hypothetical protein